MRNGSSSFVSRAKIRRRVGSSPRNDAIAVDSVRRNGANGVMWPPAMSMSARSDRGIALADQQDVLARPRAALDQLEALEAVVAADPPRLALQRRPSERSGVLAAQAQQLQAPAAL